MALVLLASTSLGKVFKRIYEKAKIIVYADGAANQTYDFLGEKDRVKYLPNAIVGDMDSIRDDVYKYYNSKVCIVKTRS